MHGIIYCMNCKYVLYIVGVFLSCVNVYFFLVFGCFGYFCFQVHSFQLQFFTPFTVNREIFAIVLFSRKFASAMIRKNKTTRKKDFIKTFRTNIYQDAKIKPREQMYSAIHAKIRRCEYFPIYSIY